MQKSVQKREYTPKASSGWNPSVDPEKPGTAYSEARSSISNINNSSSNSRSATPENATQEHDAEAREREVSKQMAAYGKCFEAAQDLFDSHHSKRLRNLLDSMAARKARAQVQSFIFTFQNGLLYIRIDFMLFCLERAESLPHISDECNSKEG